MTIFSALLPKAADGPIPRGIARTGPAIWSYGFRPFFLLAGTWALICMSLWLGVFIFDWTPGNAYGAHAWHGHEMLFGYTSAALAGFMLTAIPNWTGRLPVSGRPLMVLVSIWVVGRLAMIAPSDQMLWPAVIVDAAFFPALGFIAAREIGAGRNWKNIHIVIALTALTATNIWYHVSTLSGDDTGMAYRLAVSIWLMLIALIGGRLAVSFTRNWLARHQSAKLPASFGRFDQVTMLLSLMALASWVIIPDHIASAALLGITGLMHLIRVSRWYGWRAAKEPLVLVLHTSYFFIALGFGILALTPLGWIGQTSALHVLTVGAIGNMTLAVMTRVTRGHSGRSLTASRTTAISYVALALAALVRPCVDLFPEWYLPVLSLSALLWLSAFTLFVVEHAPMLLQPRKTA